MRWAVGVSCQCVCVDLGVGGHRNKRRRRRLRGHFPARMPDRAPGKGRIGLCGMLRLY